MSDNQRPAAAQPGDVAFLQESMLNALLLQQRLAGRAEPIDLLHRLELADRDAFYLLDHHLSALVNPKHLPAPVRIVSPAGMIKLAGHGYSDMLVIEFSPLREEAGSVQLTLRIRSYSTEPSMTQRNLGTLEVLFNRAGDRWLVRGTPTIHVVLPGRQP